MPRSFYITLPMLVRSCVPSGFSSNMEQPRHEAESTRRYERMEVITRGVPLLSLSSRARKLPAQIDSRSKSGQNNLKSGLTSSTRSISDSNN
jgi:hypothetical protein